MDDLMLKEESDLNESKTEKSGIPLPNGTDKEDAADGMETMQTGVHIEAEDEERSSQEKGGVGEIKEPAAKAHNSEQAEYNKTEDKEKHGRLRKLRSSRSRSSNASSAGSDIGSNDDDKTTTMRNNNGGKEMKRRRTISPLLEGQAVEHGSGTKRKEEEEVKAVDVEVKTELDMEVEEEAIGSSGEEQRKRTEEEIGVGDGGFSGFETEDVDKARHLISTLENLIEEWEKKQKVQAPEKENRPENQRTTIMEKDTVSPTTKGEEVLKTEEEPSVAASPPDRPPKEEEMQVDGVDSETVSKNEVESAVKKTPRTVPKKPHVDLSNPAFRKPFEYGWVRELVYRSTTDSNNSKRNADVYYYTPNGRRIRSSRELVEYLTGDLTAENFTFCKEQLGLNDDSKEVIREAKSKYLTKSQPDDVTPKKKGLVGSGKTPSSASGTGKGGSSTPATTPKVSPKETSVNSGPAVAGGLGFTPKIMFRGTTPKSRLSQTNSGSNNSKNKSDKKRKSAGPDDMDIIMGNDWNPDQKVNPRRTPVCSIECRRAMGLIPTLQCHLCLCLYHRQCVGLNKDKKKPPSHGYICKNCQEIKKQMTTPAVGSPQTGTAPSSGAPLASTDSGSGSASGKPAPLQLSPTPPPTTSTSSPTGPSGTPPTNCRPRSGSGIVGAVTTWLAPSSSIHVNPDQTNICPSADQPQGVVTVNGRRFIYVPKHNVVNVSNNGLTPMDQQEQHATDGSVSVVGPATSGGSQQQQQQQSGLFLVPCDPPSQQQQQQAATPTTPQQQTGTALITNGVKRSLESPACSPPPEKRARTAEGDMGVAGRQQQAADMEEAGVPASVHCPPPAAPPTAHNFMMNLNAGFVALLHAFQYLKVYELLRAGRVSKMWQFVASHHSLWSTVRMKNSRVSNWAGFERALSQHGTRNLDLRKMLVPEAAEENRKMWESLTNAVKGIRTLKKIDMGRCTPAAFMDVALAAPQLESLISLAIKGNEIDMKPISLCVNLTELRLKSVAGGMEIKNLERLKKLTKLKILALTTIRNLDKIEEYLCEDLVSLELGECVHLSETLATKTLPRLTSLHRLRLEKGSGPCPTIELLQAVASLPQLSQLELINFDIKPGFDKALARCTNLRTLLIIPTYVTQSATTNHVVMGGVSKLSHTLTYFIWGLTLELLKVTDLFIGQVENQKKGGGGSVGGGAMKKCSGNNDSIPILKPMMEAGQEGPSQVDILALPNLQRVLSTLLPSTKIKILKVPFSATWRQTVTDGPFHQWSV